MSRRITADLPPKDIDLHIVRSLRELNWRVKWAITGTRPETDSQVGSVKDNLTSAALLALRLKKLLFWKCDRVPQSDFVVDRGFDGDPFIYPTSKNADQPKTNLKPSDIIDPNKL